MRTLLLILASAALNAADANQASVPAPVTVTGAFARATAPSAANGAVFAVLGGGPDALLSATTDAAQSVEMHTVIALDGGGKRMTPVERIPVPGVLKPGGYHLMLMGLKKPLTEGATLTLHLSFATAGAIDAVVPVAGIAATEAPAAVPACCAPE